MSAEYVWPTDEEWRAMKPAERKHKALVLLRQAAVNERRGPGSPAARGGMSIAMRHALRLAGYSFWRDGYPPSGVNEEGVRVSELDKHP